MKDKQQQLELPFMEDAPIARKPKPADEQNAKLIEAIKLLRQHPKFLAFMERD